MFNFRTPLRVRNFLVPKVFQTTDGIGVKNKFKPAELTRMKSLDSSTSLNSLSRGKEVLSSLSRGKEVLNSL